MLGGITIIRYIGKKYLNSNFYKKITLQQEKDIIKVKTVVDNKFKNIDLLQTDVRCITDQVKNLDDYHKVEEIVFYFLRNNTINEIAQEKDEIIINSTSGRKLVLKLREEYKTLLGSIIDKYNKDRLDYIDNCKQKRIHVRTTYLNEKNKIIWRTSNYFEGYEMHKEDKIELVLTLACTKKDIATFDKVFIIEYIKELLQHAEEKIIYFDRVVGYTRHGIEVWIDDKKIDIPGELEEEVKMLIINRNIEIEKMNEKQYKLEGIKWKN